jgi:hypothetical protein
MKKMLLATFVACSFSVSASQSGDEFKFSNADALNYAMQQSSAPLDTLDKLEKSENKHAELLAQADAAESKKTITQYTSGTLALAGLVIAVSNVEKDENGEKTKTLDGTGTAGAVLALASIIVGTYLANSYGSDAEALRNEAEGVSKGLTFAPAKQGVGIAMTYKF